MILSRGRNFFHFLPQYLQIFSIVKFAWHSQPFFSAQEFKISDFGRRFDTHCFRKRLIRRTGDYCNGQVKYSKFYYSQPNYLVLETVPLTAQIQLRLTGAHLHKSVRTRFRIYLKECLPINSTISRIFKLIVSSSLIALTIPLLWKESITLIALPCTGCVCSMRQRVTCLTKLNPRGHVSIKNSCKRGCATCFLYVHSCT